MAPRPSSRERCPSHPVEPDREVNPFVRQQLVAAVGGFTKSPSSQDWRAFVKHDAAPPSESLARRPLLKPATHALQQSSMVGQPGHPAAERRRISRRSGYDFHLEPRTTGGNLPATSLNHGPTASVVACGKLTPATTSMDVCKLIRLSSTLVLRCVQGCDEGQPNSLRAVPGPRW